MKSKVGLIITAAVMFLSVFAFSINSTNAQTNANSNSLIVDALSSEVIEKADAYIELKNEKYVLSKELKNEVDVV